MKKRVISAIAMLIVCIPFLILGGIPLRVGIGILSIFAYKEVIELKGMKNYPKAVVILGLLVMILLVFSSRDIVFASLGLDYRYLMAAFLVMFLPTVFYYGTGKYTVRDAFELTSFVMFLGIILNLMSNILIYDRAYFFLILLITILTDSFAYFTGMAIGKHKVTKISPNKSLEGYIGGIVMGTVISTMFYKFYVGGAPLYTAVPVILALSAICEVGDLFFSAIKREWQIKDFSNLIPGHGGILDRIDSLTFVTMAFVILKDLI